MRAEEEGGLDLDVYSPVGRGSRASVATSLSGLHPGHRCGGFRHRGAVGGQQLALGRAVDQGPGGGKQTAPPAVSPRLKRARCENDAVAAAGKDLLRSLFA